MTESERPHLDVLARIDDNLRVALARLLLIDPQAALSLSAALLPSWWIRGRLREGIGWVEQALAAAPDAPTELLATARFAHGFLIAQDTEDWVAAARSIDVGIELLANASEPPPILGMLMCLRGGVRRLQRRCEVRRDSRRGRDRDRAPSPGRAAARGPRAFCMWNVANAKRADGDVDAAIAIFTECRRAGSPSRSLRRGDGRPATRSGRSGRNAGFSTRPAGSGNARCDAGARLTRSTLAPSTARCRETCSRWRA